MNKCPRCENENLKEEYNFCPICRLNLKDINQEKAIRGLNIIKKSFAEHKSKNGKEEKLRQEYVQILEYAIKELERTAKEVPVQEQYVTLKIDGSEIGKVALNRIREMQKKSNINIIPV